MVIINKVGEGKVVVDQEDPLRKRGSTLLTGTP